MSEPTNSLLQTQLLARAQAVTRLGITMLDHLGPLHAQQGELWAGPHRIDRMQRLFSQLAASSDMTIAVYFNQRCVVSAPSSAFISVGSKVAKALDTQVLQSQQSFAGVLEYEQSPYLVAAQPLFERVSSPKSIGLIAALHHKQTTPSRLQQHRELATTAPVYQFLDELARKLRLLALNGNIIAAQASEQGQAFRVVFQELSALAQRAKHAIQELKSPSRITD